jgi:hypothetical protein
VRVNLVRYVGKVHNVTMTTVPATRRRLPKRSLAETRELMLRAATNLVCGTVDEARDHAPSAALAHVRLTDVAAEATRIVREELAGSDGFDAASTITTGAIYQLWPSQADFQVDLLFHIAELNASSESVVDELPPMIAAAAASGQPAAETLRQTIARSFEYTRSSALFYTSLSFYKYSADERVKQAMRRCTHAFVEGIRPVWQQLLDAYDLQVRPPYTVDNLAITVGALIEGLALDWVDSPELTDDPYGQDGWSLTCRTAQMIFEQMTFPRAGSPGSD